MLPCSQMHFVILTNRILLRKGQISSASSLSLLQQDCCLVLPLSRKATPSNCELCDVGGLLFVLMQGIALRLLSVLAMYRLTPTFRALCATGPLVEELYPLQEMFAPADEVHDVKHGVTCRRHRRRPKTNPTPTKPKPYKP